MVEYIFDNAYLADVSGRVYLHNLSMSDLDSGFWFNVRYLICTFLLLEGIMQPSPFAETTNTTET